MTDNDKITLTFTIGEVKHMLLPLYEFYLFDMIRNDPDIDNPKWLRGQMEIYNRLLSAIENEDENEEDRATSSFFVGVMEG